MSLANIRARTAARKAAGVIPVYSRPTKASAAKANAPCVHLGEATGETVPCQTCAGTVALKVLACAVHGTCLPAKKVEGVACCAGCPDREEPT